MRISLDGTDFGCIQTGPWDEVLASYRESERAAGRTVPSYSWETLAALVGGWLLKKLADEAWRRIIDARSKRDAAQKAEEHGEADQRRHEELIERLAQMDANLSAPDRVARLVELAAKHKVRVSIVLDGDAERDLRAALEQLLPAETMVLLE